MEQKELQGRSLSSTAPQVFNFNQEKVTVIIDEKGEPRSSAKLTTDLLVDRQRGVRDSGAGKPKVISRASR